MGDINAIAKQFTEFYYSTFDSDRSSLAALYRDHSMLTFEAEQFQGASGIIEKLKNLPFQKVQHKIVTLDAQPSSPTTASLMVLVTGQLMVDDSPHPMNYSQTFQLLPEGGSYYVFNDIFRLVYG
ncbi:nuclear transport factor 2 [Cystobasidium minutum MCA 4210]|uniref:nuclear transport factor 2 n=1 Tax=Cystobasidium minutum MCA 4210 TaxID=1397322 RepID=UPI0034CF4B22|eukprot:jgi/Rhomi1/184325/fgenesh1_pm.7_\